jgi:hypothetical protein
MELPRQGRSQVQLGNEDKDGGFLDEIDFNSIVDFAQDIEPSS